MFEHVERLGCSPRIDRSDPLQPFAFAALAVVTVTTFAIFVLGRRFTRGYYEKHGKLPPAPWMLHASGDPELEGSRRLGLLLLPIYLVALALYLFRP